MPCGELGTFGRLNIVLLTTDASRSFVVHGFVSVGAALKAECRSTLTNHRVAPLGLFANQMAPRASLCVNLSPFCEVIVLLEDFEQSRAEICVAQLFVLLKPRAAGESLNVKLVEEIATTQSGTLDVPHLVRELRSYVALQACHTKAMHARTRCPGLIRLWLATKQRSGIVEADGTLTRKLRRWCKTELAAAAQGLAAANIPSNIPHF